jgi:hypothetical protein
MVDRILERGLGQRPDVRPSPGIPGLGEAQSGIDGDQHNGREGRDYANNNEGLDERKTVKSLVFAEKIHISPYDLIIILNLGH